jgi:dihydrolipoamide dehydrogenase
VSVKFTDAAGEQSAVFDKLIVAVGRRPYTKDLLGEGTGVEIDARGFIVVDEHCRTGAANVYAIGDCVRGPMLAHKAKEEGVMAAELIAGRYGHTNYDVVPSVIYTAPEIAWVGQTEAQARAAGINVKIGQFPFAASGRAKAMEAGSGSCRVVADADTDRILGVHIIGPMAGELIAEACLALEYNASCEDLQRTMHAHPTLSEAVHEAALNADKRAIDSLNR